MFCPQCKAEYRPGFIRCSDCGVDLVDRLPDEQDDLIGAQQDDLIDSPNLDPPDFVVIATVHNPLEEGQICSFLQANGIPAQPKSETLKRTHGMGIGFVEILVPRELADAARDLLDKADRGEFGIDASDT
jgi:hypothetical protein